jgi:hypothetical protein
LRETWRTETRSTDREVKAVIGLRKFALAAALLILSPVLLLLFIFDYTISMREYEFWSLDFAKWIARKLGV